MNTYLFVPATRTDFLSKLGRLNSDYFILDLEDSIVAGDREQAIKNIFDSNFYLKENKIVRIFWDKENLDKSIKVIDDFFKKGFKKFLIPKVTSSDQLKVLIGQLKVPKDEVELNILVENQACLANLKEILTVIKVKRVFFGSYDYCSELKIKHIPENYDWAKNYVLHISKGFNVEVIDVAYLDVTDFKGFIGQTRKAFQFGFDGKAIVHPKQLKVLDEISLYDKEDLEVALHLKEVVENNEKVPALIKYKGIYYEQAHLGYFNKILKLAGYEEINNG